MSAMNDQPLIDETFPMLPEAAPIEPPRPLVPGAFLRGEFEIKQLVARGLTNLYLAHGGDYSAPVPLLIAERALPPVVEPETEPAETAAAETLPEDELAGAMDAEASDAELIAGPADGEEELEPEAEDITEDAIGSPASTLIPPHERFAQDDREYLVFEWEESTSLQDHRESLNDNRYLQAMHALVAGVQELTEQGLSADFTRDTIRFDADGALKYYGFTDVLNAEPGEVQIASSMLSELAEVNSFLLRHVFAESSTMRLGDEFSALVLSEEIKAMSQRLRDGEYTGTAQLAWEVSQLYAPNTLRVDAALLSDVGQEREVNEDSGLIVRLHRAGHLATYTVDVFVVADGMGGHEGGEVASDLTVRALQRAVEERIDIDWDDNITVRAALLDVIDTVNAEVVALTETDRYRGTRAKPGATLVFAVQLGQRIFVGNVGDSRAYKWNAAQGLQRISKDHSYVQSLIDTGSLDPEDAWDHPDGSIITAHIGMTKLRLRDVFVRVVAPGDKLLLVSDGVVDMLRDRDIEPFLHADNSATVCRNLVNASNAAGGADNITVVCVSFS